MSWKRIQSGTVDENVFDELKRYVRFGEHEQDVLRSIAPLVIPHASAIADEFYSRLSSHEHAREVFSGPEQIQRLHRSLVVWMRECFEGPWDNAYYERRARIGHVHVKIDLPQRYMFGAMNVMRTAFGDIVGRASLTSDTKLAALRAIDKLLDLELAVMLETYREAFIALVREKEHEHHHVLERLLAVAHARYDRVVEQGEALVATFDSDGRIILFNALCERFSGLSRDHAVGRSFLDVFFPDGNHNEVKKLWQAALAGRPTAQIAREIRVQGHVRYVRWQFSILPSDSAPLLCAFGMDITEARTMFERTQRAERLASLGAMAAGLAHEIRNPLNAAHLQLTLVQRRLAKGQPDDIGNAEDAARVVASELERLGSLVTDFLQFARPRAARFHTGDLAKTVRDVTQLLGVDAGAQNVTLSAALPDTLQASFDEEYMKQVLHNLIRNAIEACAPTKGSVDVSLTSDASDAFISVRDSGPGLPADRGSIFEPFFTTKPAGTGLGLAIVHRIVTEHGGTIDVSEHDGHTLFCVRLPLTHDSTLV